MKTDADLKREVIAELEWDPAVKSPAIGVAVKGGVVTLTGHLDTYAEEAGRREALAASTASPRSPSRSTCACRRSAARDTDIAQSAESALKWRSRCRPRPRCGLPWPNGWVRLQGEVEWDYRAQERREGGARPARRRRRVQNEITLKRKPVPADLARRIQDALTRQAVREAHHVTIDVHDGTVTLRGKVNS